MMKKLYNNWLRSFTVLLVITLMTTVTVSYAQSTTVSGTVLDETGQPVPGVSILEKGTTNGTTSDSAGKYTINVSSANSVVVFSFIGYKTQEVDVAGRAVVDTSLATDATSLDEVIVTGYSSERKHDIVSAVSTISSANIVAVPVSNVEQAIQGRVAGVQVITSGQPGAPSQVRIRGFGSLTNNTPLYIVDGVPTFDVSNLNPYDIESTTVLKDAGAASIYGARAASGVVIYTTKHGRNDGKTHIDFDLSTGLNMRGTGASLLSPQQQANKVYEALRNSGATTANQPYGSDINNPVLPDYINVGVGTKNPDGSTSWKPTGNINEGDPLIATALGAYNVDPSKGAIIQVVKANKSGTDWYKEMTRVAPVTRVSLGMSGGNDRSHYYLNLAYYNQQGIALNTYLKRYNLRLNSEFKPINHVRIGENLQLSYRDNPQIGNQQSENQLNVAYRMPTIIPVYDVNGGWAGTAAPGFNNPSNALFAFADKCLRDIPKAVDYDEENEDFISRKDTYLNLLHFTNFGASPEIQLFALPATVFRFYATCQQIKYRKEWQKFVYSNYKSSKYKDARFNESNEQWESKKENLAYDSYRTWRNIIYEKLLNNQSILVQFLYWSIKHPFPFNLIETYQIHLRNMDKRTIQKIKDLSEFIVTGRGDDVIKRSVTKLNGMKTGQDLRQFLLKLIAENHNQQTGKLLISLEEYVEYLFPDGTFWREIRDLLLIAIYQKLHENNVKVEVEVEVEYTEVEEEIESETN